MRGRKAPESVGDNKCLLKELKMKKISVREKSLKHLITMDRLLAELEKRVKAYDEITEICGFSSELTLLNTEWITNKAQDLISSYPDDLENTLAAKLIQFAVFIRTQKP